MALTPGSRLGPYDILDRLGAGGMGEVYRARDPKLGRDVAVKVLPAALAADADALARFEREARTVAALNHPHIVTIHTTEQDGDVRFLTMEFVDGLTLDRVIPAAGLPVSRVLDIGIALADALAAAHRQLITHRDLKPSNVMITSDGRVKVLDFGLARTEPVAGGGDVTHQALTMAGTILGTVPYMSPEQVEARALDHRTDLFSLGVVLYEMLVGRRPFVGDSAPAVMSAILRDRPARVDQVCPEVPERLGDLVAQCLEKAAADRPGDAQDVAASLRDVRRAWESSGPSPEPTRMSDPAAPRRPHDLRVAVLRFASRGGSEAEALADGLTDDLTAGLARFPYLQVVSRLDADAARGRSADARAAETVGARYLLDGTVRLAGTAARTSVRLIDTVSGAHIWAETYDRPLAPATLFDVQDDLANRIVATVGDASGVLARSMVATLRERPAVSLGVGELVLRYTGLSQHFRPDEHRQLRDALHAALQRDPHHAGGWACMAHLCQHEHSHQLNPLPDARRRSLEAARRAIELDPACQSAWLALALVAFFDRDLAGLRMASERAVALNPLNATTLGYAGLLLAYAGAWDTGVPMVRRAMDLNPQHPGWLHYVLCVEHYRTGDFATALADAKRSNLPQFVWTPLTIAMSAGQLGLVADARDAFDDLRRHHPGFVDADRMRALWRHWHWDGGLVDRFMDGIERARTLDVRP